jgi:hypothetical protein
MGYLALQSKARGPKTNYRRTEEMVRQIILHRFLDPEASAEVIAQRLQQARHQISTRSVERVISDFGLQKNLVHQVSDWVVALRSKWAAGKVVRAGLAQ